MIRAEPLAGFATRTGFMDAYSTSYRASDSLEPRPGHVHNSYLQTAVLHGIPGLGLLLWWLVSLWRMSPSPAIPLFAAVLVNAFFDFVLADGQHALMWYVLLGILLGAPAPRTGRRDR